MGEEDQLVMFRPGLELTPRPMRSAFGLNTGTAYRHEGDDRRRLIRFRAQALRTRGYDADAPARDCAERRDGQILPMDGGGAQ